MKVLRNACRAHKNGNLRFYNYYLENLEIYSTSIICVVCELIIVLYLGRLHWCAKFYNIRKSKKDRQYNGKKEKEQKYTQQSTNHYIWNLQSEQHEPYQTLGVNSGAMEGFSVPTPRITSFCYTWGKRPCRLKCEIWCCSYVCYCLNSKSLYWLAYFNDMKRSSQKYGLCATVKEYECICLTIDNCKTVKKNVNIMKSCKVWIKYEIQGILLLWWRIIQF
jgi:hypothetical protein